MDKSDKGDKGDKGDRGDKIAGVRKVTRVTRERRLTRMTRMTVACLLMSLDDPLLCENSCFGYSCSVLMRTHYAVRVCIVASSRACGKLYMQQYESI